MALRWSRAVAISSEVVHTVDGHDCAGLVGVLLEHAGADLASDGCRELVAETGELGLFAGSEVFEAASDRAGGGADVGVAVDERDLVAVLHRQHLAQASGQRGAVRGTEAVVGGNVAHGRSSRSSS